MHGLRSTNQGLLEFHLAGNEIQNEGGLCLPWLRLPDHTMSVCVCAAKALGAALKTNQTLTHLFIHDNLIGVRSLEFRVVNAVVFDRPARLPSAGVVPVQERGSGGPEPVRQPDWSQGSGCP